MVSEVGFPRKMQTRGGLEPPAPSREIFDVDEALLIKVLLLLLRLSPIHVLADRTPQQVPGHDEGTRPKISISGRVERIKGCLSVFLL